MQYRLQLELTRPRNRVVGHDTYCHLGDSHEGMLRNGIGALAGETDKRIGGCKVDDDSAADVACAVPAGPSLGCLLSHRRHLGTDTHKVAASVDVHDTIKVVDIGLGDGCIHAVVDLIEALVSSARSTRPSPGSGVTHPGSIDGVVEAAELSDHVVHHILHRLVVLDVHCKARSLVVFVARILLAFFRRGFRR